MMLDIVNLKIMAAVMARTPTHTSVVLNEVMSTCLSESQMSINAGVPETRKQLLLADEGRKASNMLAIDITCIMLLTTRHHNK